MEMRNLGVTDDGNLQADAFRALDVALDRCEDRIRRVRVRFIPAGEHGATCRVRVWYDTGPTVVVEEDAATSIDAVNAVAAVLKRTLHRGRRDRHR